MKLPKIFEKKRKFKIGDYVRVVEGETKETKLLDTQIEFTGKIFQVIQYSDGFKGDAYVLNIPSNLKWNFYDANLDSIDKVLRMLDEV